MASSPAGALAAPGRLALTRLLQALSAVGLALVLAGAGSVRAGAISPPLDASGAFAFLAFCRSVQEGHPWSEGAIRSMAASAPYQAMIAHHASLDPSVTSEAFVAMLLALRDGRPYPGPPGRLLRVSAMFQAAMGQLPILEARLQAVCASRLVDGALARARANLPPGATVRGRVYLLADGFTAVYGEGDAFVLDLLQASRPEEFEAQLAHELHHAGTASLLPAPCPDPQLGLALDTLAGLLQEGTASYWLAGWRATPAASDYAQVAAFLHAVLAEGLAGDEAEEWFTALVNDGRDGGGPLYRVGNAIVAQLSAQRGQAWVRARLGDPVGLLRAWQAASGDSPFREVLALLEGGQSKCPAWLGRN